MITNNSYIRSDYGIINKNIIAQTKLNEYDKESNKNFLTTKEYVDSKTNNVEVKLIYTVGVPYVHKVSDNKITAIQESNDEDGKKVLYDYTFNNASLIKDEYFIIKETENTISKYKLVKGNINNNSLIITEKLDLVEGTILFSKYDLQYYILTSFNNYNSTNLVENKQILTPINNLYIFITNTNSSPKTLDDKIIFNIMNSQIINHNINLNNIIINNNFFNNNNNIFINDLLSIFNNNNITLINEFYRNYFKDILKLYNNSSSSYFNKLIKDANQIIYFKSYSGIPKITITPNNIQQIDYYIIKIPIYDTNNTILYEFQLENTYQNLKEENFYVIIRHKEDITINNNDYEIYTGEIELNNNGIIETNVINIKYQKDNQNNITNNDCNFETENYNNTNIHFILINYDKQHILDIYYTLNEQDEKEYHINKITKINETTFYKDLTLLCNLNIHYNIEYDGNDKLDNNITKEEFIYTFSPLSSFEQQRVKNWEYDNINNVNDYNLVIPQYIYINNSISS